MPKPGWRSRPIHTVGGANNFVTRSRSIVAGSAPGRARGRITRVAPSIDVGPQEAVELGAVVERQRVHLDVVGAPSRRRRRSSTYCAISERLVSIAPLGRDSVPLVYISRSGSSSATTVSTGGACRGGRTSPATSSQPVARRRAGQPDPAQHPRRRPARRLGHRLDRHVGPGRPRRRRPWRSLWSRMKATSPAPSMKLTGTRTAPSRAVAKRDDDEPPVVVAQQREPVAVPQTRARPARRRCDRRARPARRRSAACRRRRSASLSGIRAAVRRSRSPSDCWRTWLTSSGVGVCGILASWQENKSRGRSRPPGPTAARATGCGCSALVRGRVHDPDLDGPAVGGRVGRGVAHVLAVDGAADR